MPLAGNLSQKTFQQIILSHTYTHIHIHTHTYTRTPPSTPENIRKRRFVPIPESLTYPKHAKIVNGCCPQEQFNEISNTQHRRSQPSQEGGPARITMAEINRSVYLRAVPAVVYYLVKPMRGTHPAPCTEHPPVSEGSSLVFNQTPINPFICALRACCRASANRLLQVAPCPAVAVRLERNIILSTRWYARTRKRNPIQRLTPAVF